MRGKQHVSGKSHLVDIFPFHKHSGKKGMHTHIRINLGGSSNV